VLKLYAVGVLGMGIEESLADRAHFVGGDAWLLDIGWLMVAAKLI
jgi:hypothetical protein